MGSTVCGGFEGAEQAVEREREQQREQGVRDEDAGEEEDAGGGEQEDSGIKRRAFAKGAARPDEAEQRQCEDGERERQMDGERVASEDTAG